MAKMETMSRVLVDHNWSSLQEWVRAVRDLADLDDQALDELERMSNRDKRIVADLRQTAAPSSARDRLGSSLPSPRPVSARPF